ncbi:MAG TPA: type II toxin-antitoxin system VapC family toxin [Methylococcus sp.]|nr:type II toxin-antitoxin system VapC family toxin [Methylococcus sp.]
MKLLLDTCVFLWLIWDEPELTPAMRALLADPEHEVFLSAVSVWEATHKHALGKLTVFAPEGAWAHFVRQRAVHEIRPLSFDEADARHLPALPPIHRDSFDRLLICQAIEQGMALITPDAMIQRYPIRTLWD